MWVSDGKVAFILPEVCKIILFSCLLYVLFCFFWRGECNFHRWVSHPKGDESHWCTQAPPTPGANQLIMWAGLCYCERLNYWFVRTFRLIAVRARASSPATMYHSCCFSHRANAVITLLCHSYKCSNNCTCTKVMLSGLFFCRKLASFFFRERWRHYRRDNLQDVQLEIDLTVWLFCRDSKSFGL